MASTATGIVLELSGKEFDLIIAQTAVNFTGSPHLATTINGSIPAPILRWREGETVTMVTIRVTNHLEHKGRVATGFNGRHGSQYHAGQGLESHQNGTSHL